MLKWMIVLALSACGSFLQPGSQLAPTKDVGVASPQAQMNSDLEALFETAGLKTRRLEAIYWPESAGRYAGILRQVTLDFSDDQVQNDFRTRLQAILIPWLEAQDHPEAQCVSVQQQVADTPQTARFLLEIVCR